MLDPKTIGSIIAAIAGVIAAWITGRHLQENTRLTNWLQEEKRKADREDAERLALINTEESRQARLDKQTWELLEQYRREVAGLREEIEQLREEHKAEVAALREERNEQVDHLQREYERLIRENSALRARVAELEHLLNIHPGMETAT